MRREGDACRPDSLVRPVPLPEHLPLPQEPIIEDVIENESDKQVITDEPKGEIPAEQDTGMRGMFDRTDRFPAYSLTTSRDATRLLIGARFFFAFSSSKLFGIRIPYLTVLVCF